MFKCYCFNFDDAKISIKSETTKGFPLKKQNELLKNINVKII